MFPNPDAWQADGLERTSLLLLGASLVFPILAACGCVLKGAGGHSGAMGQEAGLSNGSRLAVDGTSNIGQGMSYSLGAKFFTLVRV